MRNHFEEPPIAVSPATDEIKAALCENLTMKRSGSLPPDLIQTSSTHGSANCSLIRDDESSFASDKSFVLSDQSTDEEPEEDCDVSICSGEDNDNKLCSSTGEKNVAELEKEEDQASFMSLRVTYLIVTLVVMLADGLQGTHLYVLYEGYGFTVANLYCLGFVTGGLASPITGPLVDKFGRKKSAILYCILEILINRLEQYPMLAGLIFSRMVGGITTNLLSTVFDTWLDTEYRRRGIRKEGGYEIIMRDSVIVSNLAAIGSGYLAHVLADTYGPKGPFEGAVACTSIALVVIMSLWTENFGQCDTEHQAVKKGIKEFMSDAVTACRQDNKVLRLGIIQGLTCASIQIFIFLWSPALRHFAVSAPTGSLGLDSTGEPAYGLIFGAFMAAGVLGGLAAPWVRRCATSIMKPNKEATATVVSQLGRDGQQTNDDRQEPMAVEALSSVCYLSSAFLLLLPCLLDGEGEHSFSICLVAFLVYEFIVGLYLPCEGVLRSIYFPAEGRASILTLPRIVVNCSVSVGVVLTNYMTMRSAFSSIVVLMVMSAGLQLSLIVDPEYIWSLFAAKVEAKPSIPPKSRPSWECAPDVNRASFSGHCDTDDSSLSSETIDEKTKTE